MKNRTGYFARWALAAIQAYKERRGSILELRSLRGRRCVRLLLVLAAVGFAAPSRAEEVSMPEQFIAADVQHDVSPPLRTLSAMAVSGQAIPRIMPLHRLPLPPGGLQSDGALQSNASIPLAASIGMNFDGLGVNTPGFTPIWTPPDTTGAAGLTQYVQWVNTSFTVFDKSSGQMLLSPLTGNAIWFGFGGGCAGRNDGDPIVNYDKQAKRWVLSQFTSASPYLECVAVSATDDATGVYYRYAFAMGPNFADYPHMGVWPDGYYFSFNMFSGKPLVLVGGRACAFDRNAMLNNSTATAQCFDVPALFGSVPSDWDGASAPPLGSPNYFVTYGSNLLNIWSLHADFTNPANANLNGPIALPVQPFTPACAEVEPGPIKKGDPEDAPGCVPQAGVAMKLDELSDRMMYRAAYRNFGDHEALVATHTVARVIEKKKKAIGAALRWYEIRGLSTTPNIYQQGTYAPDARWRWMGSIGMDFAGDIGIGYSLSAPGIHPHIAYTGRTPGDLAGTMESEGIIMAGKGSQRGMERWGDYSALSIDPSDDCTFWYTTEYIPKTGDAPNWQTRIASFKFPSCTGAGSY